MTACATWTPRRARALTLVELLTSVSICLALSMLATVSFIQIRAVLQRMQVRLEMHNAARYIHQALSEQIAALQQDGAMWVETRQDDGSGDGQVAITFLKGKTDEHDFTTSNGSMWYGEGNSVYQNRCTDLTWCSWSWDQKHGILSSGATSHPRQFKINTPWIGPNGNYQSTWMANMPQPLRSADPYPAALPAGSAQAALSGSRYGSSDYANDISDYQDLQDHMAPAMRNVTGFAIEMILSDGSVMDAGVGQTQEIALDGSFIDAHAAPDASGNAPYKKRPRLIRVLIDMSDPQTGVSQSFSFSFQPPGMLPPTYPAGASIP